MSEHTDILQRVAVLEAEMRNTREAMRNEGDRNREELGAMRRSVDQLLASAQAGSKIAGWLKTGVAITTLLAFWTGAIAWLLHQK